MRALVSAFLVSSAAVGAAEPSPSPSMVSIDYCADQFAFALKNDVPVLAVSKDADGIFSVFSEKAQGLPQTRGNAEELLIMRPDVAVRGWRGGPAFDQIMASGGITAFGIGFPQTQADMFARLRELAQQLGKPDAAEAFITAQSEIEAEVKTYSKTNLKAAYMTPSGYTAGKGTLVEDMLHAAGFESISDTYNISGWMPMPLEATVKTKPDIIVASFFDMDGPSSHWSASAHPHFRGLMENIPTLYVPSRFLSCGRMFLPNAAQHLRMEAVKAGIVKN